MTNEVIQISEQRTSRKPKCNRLAELNRALNLVRAVGMNDDMASDWLASALFELQHLPDSAFLKAVAKARRTCRHHSDIVPTMIDEGEKAQHATMADKFIGEWNRALEDYRNGYKPRLTNQTEAQRLIGNAVDGCKP